MLRRGKLNTKGSSWIEWSAVVILLVAALAFFRVPLKRGIQQKSMAAADYVFWTFWDPDAQPQDHKGDFNTFSASNNTQTNWVSTQHRRGGHIIANQSTVNDERSASASLDETDSSLEPVLKSIDLEKVLSYNEGDKPATP